MKIAVTYDNGQIFQHFGRTPAYELAGKELSFAIELLEVIE